MLKWDPIDFLECLEVEPVSDAHGVEYIYEVVKDGLKLIIRVFQYDGDIYFSLVRDREPKATIINMKICQCPAVSFTKFGKDEYLNFFPGRRPERLDDESSISKGIKIRIKPDIKLELYE